MNSKVTRLAGWSLVLAAMAGAAQLALRAQRKPFHHYAVTDLGLTNSFSNGINNRGLIAETVILGDGVTQHAFLWRMGMSSDIGDSSAFIEPREKGQIASYAVTSTPDPLGEDFCGYNTHLICKAFVWQDGAMVPLAMLGGNNSWAYGGTNNRGQVVGVAENDVPDSTCLPPQVLQTKPVIWEEGRVRELPTISGDPDGVAYAINDDGEAVGASSHCAMPVHAVLWRKDGSVIDLGNLGGEMNNAAKGINNRGQVVGFSDLPGDSSSHAFLWENGIMTDLGTVAGLPTSLAFGINDDGQVVGMLCDIHFDCGAYLWQDGVMTDLNTLLPNGSPWNLIASTSINSRGEIVGVGDTGDGFHAVLVTPCDSNHPDVEGCDYSLADENATRKEQTIVKHALTPEAIRLLLRSAGLRSSPWYRKPGVSPQQEALTAISATVGLSPTSLNFGTVAIGMTSAERVTVTNTGTTIVTISDIAIAGANIGDFEQTNTCSSPLGAHTSCTIDIFFKPLASGTRIAAVRVSDNAAGSPQQVTLSGIGTQVKLIPARLTFGSGTIGVTSPPQTVTLTNVGTNSLRITGIAVTGTNAGDFAQTHTCGSSLPVGASCTISVTFKPTAYGLRTAALAITDSAAGSPQMAPINGGCIPYGGFCYGRQAPCCRAPYPHHSFCSDPTGPGTCIES